MKLRIRKWKTEDAWTEVEFEPPRLGLNLAQAVVEAAARLAGLRGPTTSSEQAERSCPFCEQANGASFKEPGVLFLEVELETRLRRVEKLNEGWPAMVVCAWVSREEAQAELDAAAAGEDAPPPPSRLPGLSLDVVLGQWAAQQGQEIGRRMQAEPCANCGHGRLFHRKGALRFREEADRLPEHACRAPSDEKPGLGSLFCRCDAYQPTAENPPKETP